MTTHTQNNPKMQAIIDARVKAIRQAHANNLIEGLDVGTETFEAMLERAREPISTEEFTRRELALCYERHQRHQVDQSIAAAA